MKKLVFITAILIFLCLGSGCQYANARLRDAADCIAASFSIGPGFVVEAQALWFAHAGIGGAAEDRFSFYYGAPLRSEVSSGLLGLPPLFSIAGDDYSIVMSGFFMPLTNASGDHLVLKNPFNPLGSMGKSRTEESVDRQQCRYSNMDIGARVHLGYVGLELKFRLNEIIDFVFGLLTIDIIGDDIRVYPEPPEQDERKREEDTFEDGRSFSLP